MRGAPGQHLSVMASPAITWLKLQPAGVYVDGTAGAGGHSALILEQLTSGRLIALDRDPEAVARVQQRFQDHPNVNVVHANYGDLQQVLKDLAIERVDGVLIDAGLSSIQLDDPERGFTFQSDGPLDMRMNTEEATTAAAWLQQSSEEELAQALRTYGDVGPVKRIAKAIVRRRTANRLQTTQDLIETVSEALNHIREVPEEVRTVFMAIRMAVNEELRWLEKGVEEAAYCLKPGGRLAVIAFHSGEDRVVKNVMRRLSRKQRQLRPDGRIASTQPAVVKVLTPKPILPEEEEIRRNPRAKSAKMRIAERLNTEGSP